MGYLEILGLVVSGAGTMASILGIFFAVYAKQNGRVTRELIREIQTETQNLIRQTQSETQSLIKEMRNEMRNTIITETRLTRELIEKIDKRGHTKDMKR
ncbi:MAG: hypothetical protein AB1797_08550 [bacterium]